MRFAFYSKITEPNIPLSISELYEQTLNYQASLKKQILFQKASLPAVLKNVELRFHNPQYGYVIFNTKSNVPSIFFESTKYHIPLAYMGENKFAAEDPQHNFNSSLKRVIFPLSDNRRQISMQIDMDNQQGGLTFIENQKFYQN